MKVCSLSSTVFSDFLCFPPFMFASSRENSASTAVAGSDSSMAPHSKPSQKYKASANIKLLHALSYCCLEGYALHQAVCIYLSSLHRQARAPSKLGPVQVTPASVKAPCVRQSSFCHINITPAPSQRSVEIIKVHSAALTLQGPAHMSSPGGRWAARCCQPCVHPASH